MKENETLIIFNPGEERDKTRERGGWGFCQNGRGRGEPADTGTIKASKKISLLLLHAKINGGFLTQDYFISARSLVMTLAASYELVCHMYGLDIFPSLVSSSNTCCLNHNYPTSGPCVLVSLFVFVLVVCNKD